MWTTVAKPTGTNYTNVNPIGKEQYDQASITYDDASTYYDGVIPLQWTRVSKAAIGGYDIPWSDMSMMWEDADLTWGGGASSWTAISKPT